MFGAMKDDLPDIWEELNNAGFESGQAYGKSLRTVKSCVGTTCACLILFNCFRFRLIEGLAIPGCRYGVGDSVGLAVQLEQRYRGVRSPHKFKGGVSGCVRECAEAQSKDFGVIATDKGWNSEDFFASPRFSLSLMIDAVVFVGGNGGANPVSVYMLSFASLNAILSLFILASR